jgi:endonuclease/exonuclease/phosphatase (EEP) superfamily protein YafD
VWKRDSVGKETVIRCSRSRSTLSLHQDGQSRSDALSRALHRFAAAESDRLVIVGGDFNTIEDRYIVEATGFTSYLTDPTRGRNRLDKVFTDSKCRFTDVQVIARNDHTVRTEHGALYCQ